MKLADRTKLVPASEIRKMYNMARGRPNILDLTVGQPDFDTPQFIKDAGKKALDEGFTKYTHNAGLIEVREALAKKAKRENGIDADPAKEVICTAGGMGSLLLANLALVNPGDEVLYPDPGFVSHYAHIMLTGGVPVPFQQKRENGFAVKAEDIEKLITSKTKLLVINYPNNPTGGVISNSELKKIADLAIKKDIIVLADEAYEKFRYVSEKPLFIGSLPGMKERTVTLFSFSKSYAMTGWRIGFAIGPEEVVAAMTRMQEHVLSMPTAISQKAAEAAVNGPQDCVEQMLSTFRKRRDLVTKGLQSIQGIRVDPPAGAFYVFPDVSAYKTKSYDLAVKLLEDTGVVTVHGSGFGKYGEGYLRLCYAVSTETIEEALRRLDTYLPKLLRKQK
jgi:aspartate/methionine/tyrosine aminotransferase